MFKKALFVTAIVVIIIIASIESAQAANQRLVLSDFASKSFLMANLSLILMTELRYWLKLPRRKSNKPVLNIYQLAYLAGGKIRAVDLAIVQLVKNGYLIPNVQKLAFSIKKRLPDNENQLEQQVMKQVFITPSLKRLREICGEQTVFLRMQIEQEQLFVPERKVLFGKHLRIFAPIIFVVAMVFFKSISVDIFIAYIAVFIGSFFLHGERTHWGNFILRDIQNNHDSRDMTEGFAIHGYKVLSGGALNDLRHIYQAQEIQDQAEVAANSF
jgi:uncharacterized protein (TIGR04222 family)